MTALDQFFNDQRILITGVCGTIGRRILSLLLEGEYHPGEIIGLDNNEGGLFSLQQRYFKEDRCCFFLADVRDREKLIRKFDGVDIVFHTAAFKHVVLCERSPLEAIQTNVLGVQNVIDAARETNAKTTIFTSSDKAVNPTSVMGTSKLMGERIMTAANSGYRGDGSVFASTRFGNVLGSSGSVVPIFHRQIAAGGPVTLTDTAMTRFVMSIDQAVQLVIDSAAIAKGGEVFITKMPVVRIQDLAEVMIEMLGPLYGHPYNDIQLDVIGTQPGEKLYEELMSQEEMRRAVELSNYFSVLPAFRGIYRNIVYDYEGVLSKRITNPYNSANEAPMSKSKLTAFLEEKKLLTPGRFPTDLPSIRYWPGESRIDRADEKQ